MLYATVESPMNATPIDDGEAERRVGDEGRVLGGDVLRVDGVVNDAAIGATELPDADWLDGDDTW
jgi:hypothetical protein